MNNLSSYCKNHDPTGFHLQNEWRPEGARNQTYYCWSTMCTLHVSMSPFLCRTCGLYLGLPRLVRNDGHKEIFLWLYILFMGLQSFGFNLFGSKSETLPKTVSHHAVFCLFFPVAVESRQTCCHNRTVLEKILTFGRELQNMSIQLRREHGKNETNKKALQVRIYTGDV